MVARQKKARVSAVKRAIVLGVGVGLACECTEGGFVRRCCLECDWEYAEGGGGLDRSREHVGVVSGASECWGMGWSICKLFCSD